MQKKTPEPYPFEFVGGVANIHTFTTAAGMAYAVRFKPTPYLLNLPAVAEQVYELVIDPVRTGGPVAGPDPVLAVTVAAICQDFLSKQERIMLYICETADGKHLARIRKFDSWFRQFNDASYGKIDAQFRESDAVTYYLSLIFRWSHPERHQILDAFKALADQYNTGK